GWEDDGQARIIRAGLLDATVSMPFDELAEKYSGMAIYARPRFLFDNRAPETASLPSRHWFWGAIMDNLPVYRDVLVAAGLINVFALAMPLFIMNVYDRVVPNQALETLWLLAIGLVIIHVADFGLRTLRAYYVDLAGRRVDVRLSSEIMQRVLGIRMEQRPLSAGAFAANLHSFEAVRTFITSATVVTLIDVPFSFLFLVVLFWLDTPMFIPAFVGICLLVAYTWLVQTKMNELAEVTQRASAVRNASLVESLVSLETVKAMGAEGLVQRKWERSVIFLARISNQMRILAASSTNFTMWVNHLSYVVVVILAVYRIVDGALSTGGLIACVILSNRAMATFASVASLMTQYNSAKTSLATINKVMGSEVERPDQASFISRPHLAGAIEFKDASFTYPGTGNPEALSHVSITIQAGEHVALVGRVGSGKSTLLRLILGLYRPTGGSVHIDGVDIRQLDPSELRRNIGYVPQDAGLFYGSLKENIELATPVSDDADLIRAAEIAGLSDLVNSHPQGFDMVIGERGESLSGGQRQAVAIARAVVRDPPILLLDEPTGSVDRELEDTIKRNLQVYGQGKTLLLVTHRTPLMELADRVIVVDSGRIVADGPKDEVLEKMRQGKIGRAP
ncbi:MAG: type I secretion system permease/ATPase, partial [Thiobacillus sp.]|nr:type I secretion system permease/ATPase [Thiobacillus sp.]